MPYPIREEIEAGKDQGIKPLGWFDIHPKPNVVSIFYSRKPKEWRTLGERRALKLFHAAATRVPAYKDFLKKHKINHLKIKTWADFQKVPIVTKDNYLRKYQLEKLCWSGHLNKPLVFTSTSGSTGEPFYFPRGQKLDWQNSVFFEKFLENSSMGKDGPILVIVAFGMGVWIGGLLSYKGSEMAAQRNHSPLSIITPGINKHEIFNALKKLAPKFKQTILMGYPPFIKDVIDEASEQGINLKKLNLRLSFAAEAFSEEFRNYMSKKVGIKNPFLDIVNIYGSADLGAMGTDTAATILVKRLALKNKKLMGDIFGASNITPTLAQYIPYFIKFETVNNEVLLTGDNALPLIRYSIGDRGGVIEYDELLAKLKTHDIDLYAEAKKVGIEKHISQLPMVYVFERADFSTKLYGAIIYPEHIKTGLEIPAFNEHITGKFVMSTKTDKRHNQFLEINIELKPNTTGTKSLKNKITSSIVTSLLKRSAEYENNYKALSHRVIPKVFLWPYGDAEHFKPGIKQRWIKK